MSKDAMSKYDDIINLPHHVSSKRKPMSMMNRAAQFAPFAALTGHSEAINETARITCEKKRLSDHDLTTLSKKLSFLVDNPDKCHHTTFLCFIPDNLKSGGRYTEIKGMIRRIDEYDHKLHLTDGAIIPLDSIIDISGDCLDEITW